MTSEKYGQQQPLNRHSERYACEGVDLSLSPLADQVGGAALLRPLYDLIRAHVFAGERVHGDDTPVPLLAKGKTATGRAWVYVRDDRPFGGRDPPAAAVVYYSRDRTGEHPERHLQAMAASFKPTPMPASTGSITGPASRGRSLKQRAGHTAGASSSCSPT